MFYEILNFLKSKRDIIYIVGIVIISLFLYNQCDRNTILDKEVHRLENNIYAITDTLTQYKDDNGRIIAEKHALILTQEELEKNIDLLKTKNKEYIAYINSQISIVDTINVPTFIERPFEVDTTYYADQGIIQINKSDIFGKSNRELSVSIPYTFDKKLNTGYADINLSQNIFVESILERDKKTGETYVKLISDYPVSFNSGMGVIVSNLPSYEKTLRKTKGIGIGIGPSIGMNYDLVNKKIIPTVGVNLTIGFTYTPKFLQW